METYKIVVLGTGGVGKSAMTLQLVQNQFVAVYDPTIEDSYKKTIPVDGVELNLDILDTAGQDDFRPLRATHMRTGQGFLVVFALNDMSSFDAVDRIQSDIRSTCEQDDVPIVVCGNKSDLVSDRTVKREDAERFCRDVELTYFETSSKNNVNVTEAFVDLARKMRERNPDRPAAQVPEGRAKTSEGNKEGCCHVA
jgi:small GTP-binding protein